MSTGRSLTDKIADTLRAYEVLREPLTNPDLTAILQKMTGPDAQAAVAAAGDPNAYVALVQASLSLVRTLAANDRTAMMAAAIITQSGVVRPVLEEGEL